MKKSLHEGCVNEHFSKLNLYRSTYIQLIIVLFCPPHASKRRGILLCTMKRVGHSPIHCGIDNWRPLDPKTSNLIRSFIRRSLLISKAKVNKVMNFTIIANYYLMLSNRYTVLHCISFNYTRLHKRNCWSQASFLRKLILVFSRDVWTSPVIKSHCIWEITEIHVQQSKKTKYNNNRQASLLSFVCENYLRVWWRQSWLHFLTVICSSKSDFIGCNYHINDVRYILTDKRKDTQYICQIIQLLT